MINVTKPFLPPKNEYLKLINEIWTRNWLTNDGPILNRFELELKTHLGINKLVVVNNGSVAIQIAIAALGLTGEIITTPFSHIATSSNIVWMGLKPVFVDISPLDFNINPDLIVNKVTKETSALLVTNVFGNSSNIEVITKIAKKHNLKLIFDSAHCFGTLYKNKSIFEFGDISTTSFHATKLLSSVEGGSLFTKDRKIYKKMSFLRNFGHNGPAVFNGVGINAKCSEFHAAMGVINLKHIDQILERRKHQWKLYQKLLKKTNLKFLKINLDTSYNYAYFPIVFQSEATLLQAVKALNGQNIHPRRYFYPSLNSIDYLQGDSCPVSESISKRVLVLPLYHDLIDTQIEQISQIIIKAL